MGKTADLTPRKCDKVQILLQEDYSGKDIVSSSSSEELLLPVTWEHA